ncbi:MAG: DinB family protein [Actinomycetota bacterium]
MSNPVPYDPSAPPRLPHSGDEPTLLRAFLDVYRFELLNRAHGLDHTQLRQTLPPSTLSIGRLIGHMTFVEYIWFAVRLDGAPPPDHYDTLDWEADPDAEMTRAETLDPETLRAEYQAAVADSNRRIDAADSLDVMAANPRDGVDNWDLRWIMIHMIEEYARHCGHADLIRESIDGTLAQP